MTRKKLLLFLVAVVIIVGSGAFLLSAYSRPRVAQQPIRFSHKIHAEDFKIACEYCHSYARRAAVAGIPSVQRCMGCHKITAADKPEIQKLQNHWNQKQPIQWVKVTSMPDFVFFEHWPHIRAGVKCQTCHGSIETMEETLQVKPLNMSECLACHRKEKVSIDCVTCHR
ncbi:MAG: cytochrome c3 family protein [Deltaproteobacteria bacterium]|nr:cytochrome c3 family protein [Deltaproteobacteria bacterium]